MSIAGFRYAKRQRAHAVTKFEWATAFNLSMNIAKSRGSCRTGRSSGADNFLSLETPSANPTKDCLLRSPRRRRNPNRRPSTESTMPPSLGLRAAFRALTITARPVVRAPLRPGRLSQLRTFADNTTSTPPPQIPGQDGMPIPDSFTGSAKEEPEQAAAAEGQESAGSAESAESAEPASPLNQLALDQLQLASYGLDPFDPHVVGHKYGLPELPIPSNMRAKHRYDPVVEQMTRLIMRDGKLSKAQRVSSDLHTCL